MAAKTRTSLTSLERLERQLLPIRPSRAQGDAWEKALKGWINAGGHPELTKAWMWGEWPGKLKAGLKGDKGVDLVAETRDKQLVAIQVKFRENPNDPVTAPEVQKLVGSYRKHFTLFALASNAWSATRGVSEAVGEQDAMLILREQLLESSYDWAAKKSIKRTKFTPFPFQKVAAENVRKTLEKGGRAQIVMACGTGKTVTMLLAAEALDAQRVLVLAPTLLLVKQLRDEWISKRRPDREWASLAVCSDIGDGVDASEIAPAEFGAPPTTNPDDIAAFLKKPGRRVVFGTYASSDRIAKAQKKAGVPAFDLAVADEAHRIAGVVSAKDRSERSQRVMLEEKEIKAVRRLFATATPRITGAKKTREGDEILIESMDDESRFGKVAHSVTFQEAVKLKRLVPYKLVVTIVTDDDVAQAVHNRKFIDVNGKTFGTDEVATAIAIRRAYKDLGISKIISYHSRVAGARAFADLITQVPGRGKSPVTEHVAGSMPVNDRRQVLNRLAAATEPYLVTNARCLTEGIDVPALDAVAFADPRKSQVDIVQAVGRAMRRPMGTSKKTTGYIILPVYLTKDELKDPEIAVESSAFEPVLQVLRALKDHDPFMARFMAKILFAKGKSLHQKSGGITEILEVSISDGLDKVLARQLLEAVHLRAVEVSASPFEFWLEVLKQFVHREGHALVPQSWKEDGFKLGIWVASVRSDGLRLRPELKAQLDLLGFVWDARTTIDELKFKALESFVKREGHARVPVSWTEDGVNLGHWVGSRRKNRATLSPAVISRLDRLGFVWDTAEADFEEGLRRLKEYVHRNGHAKVPQKWSENGVKLGVWVATLRRRRAEGYLTAAQVSQLDQLGMKWDPFSEQFAENLTYLREFIAKQGHSYPPRGYRVGTVDLGGWAINLRASRGELDVEKIVLLDSIGFDWASYADHLFNKNYLVLADFVRTHGHARVPRGFKVGEVNLGSWVGTLRVNRVKLDQEKVSRLDQLGFVWDVREVDFQKWILLLRSFVAREGHARVTQTWKENGENLGSWVRSVRAGAVILLPAWRNELNELGFVWDATVDPFDTWLKLLDEYVKREGDARVPYEWVEDGKALGSWVSGLRAKRDRLPKDRIAALDRLGFVWDPADADFERNFRMLQAFAAREGHVKVPQKWVENGVRLGGWIATLRQGEIRLTTEQLGRLNAIGFIWKPFEAALETKILLLEAFVKREGHAKVPQSWVENGVRLGTWVANIRSKPGRIDGKTRARLDRLGFVWNLRKKLNSV
jgi:superfamily II DNA or RNA helicase